MLDNLEHNLVLPMNTTAFQAKNVSKAHTRPLRILLTTVCAYIVSRHCLDNRLIGGGHLRHGELIFFGRIVSLVDRVFCSGKRESFKLGTDRR